MLFSLSTAKFKIKELKLKNGENINKIKKAPYFSILFKNTVKNEYSRIFKTESCLKISYSLKALKSHNPLVTSKTPKIVDNWLVSIK